MFAALRTNMPGPRCQRPPVPEIAAVPGLGLRTAQAIYDALHPGEDGQRGETANGGEREL